VAEAGGPTELTVSPIEGLPEVEPGFDLGSALARATELADGDVVAISQKVVSKAEGRLVELDSVRPGPKAVELAGELDRDPRVVEVILAESASVVRTDRERGILITETRHGFICANSGIDSSNAPDEGVLVLLPEDPDRSARAIRAAIFERAGTRPAIVISDSFGRAWRLGQVEVAIGCAGLDPLDDWRGKADSSGRELTATEIGIADEIASAADLVRNKTSRTPAVRIRGLDRFVRLDDGPGCAGQIRPAGEDLFR
jgi:coenzyme F420-0:L-glutamate ligase/coenzyme F420-1:gamma-L-glutamate ligase